VAEAEEHATARIIFPAFILISLLPLMDKPRSFLYFNGPESLLEKVDLHESSAQSRSPDTGADKERVVALRISCDCHFRYI
jgi:hypothetical protein